MFSLFPILIGLAFFNPIGGRVSSPVGVFIISWSAALLFIDISSSTYSISFLTSLKVSVYFMLAIFAYFAAGCNGNLIFRGIVSDIFSVYKNKWIEKFGYILMFVVLIVFYSEFRSIFEYDSIAEYYYFSRVASLNGGEEERTFIYYQLQPFIFIYSLYYMIYSIKVRGRMGLNFILLIFLTCLILSLSGTRSVMILFLLSLLFSWVYIVGPRIKSIIIPALAIFGIFLISAYYMRVTEADKASGVVVNALWNQFVIYLAGGVKGYDIFAGGGIDIYHEQLSKIFMTDAAQFSMDFVKLGPIIEGNVFGALSVYEYYFGYFGACVFIFFIFFVASLLFRVNGGDSFVAVKAMISAAVFLMIFHDYFFSIFPYLARYFLFCFVIYSSRIVSLRF